MIFYDDEHEEMFNKLCGKMPYLDGYHLSLAYLLTMDAVLRYHIGALYDVKKDVIIFEGLSKPFQTQHALHLIFGTARFMTQIHLKLISTKMERKNMYQANTMRPTEFSTARIRHTIWKRSR